MEKLIGKTCLKLVQGDITLEGVEALVNAANSGLRGGGGVDGAIHRAGGPSIMEQCRKIGGCPTGQAVLTTGGRLKAKYIIHTVGPIWRGGEENEEQLLASAYENSLKLAQENRIRSLAFPSISTGVYGFPIEKAAEVALQTIGNYLKQNQDNLEEVRCVLFSNSDFKIYEAILKKLYG